MPKVQTTSMKNAENRGVVGEVVCVLGAVVSVVVAMLAAGPLCWQHEPFNAQLNPIGGMVGSLPKPPPIGLTCASKGPACAGCVHRNTRGSDGSQASRRSLYDQGDDRGRDPEGSRLSLRTVAAPSALKS